MGLNTAEPPDGVNMSGVTFPRARVPGDSRAGGPEAMSYVGAMYSHLSPRPKIRQACPVPLASCSRVALEDISASTRDYVVGSLSGVGMAHGIGDAVRSGVHPSRNGSSSLSRLFLLEEYPGICRTKIARSWGGSRGVLN